MNGEATDDVRDRAREAIRRSGLSQREFAHRLVIDPTKLSKSLTGRRRFTPEELASIALEAGVTVNWLLNGDDDAVTVAAAPRDTAVAARPAGPASRPLRGDRWQGP